jgi:ankyrin repeat protein
VEAGANVNITTINGIGPLYLAVKGSSIECASYLLSQGAEIYYNDIRKVDNSPVIFATK